MTEEKEAITLAEQTAERYHAFYCRLVPDPALLSGDGPAAAGPCAPEQVDRLFSRLRETPDKKSFAILLDGEVIGDVALKHIDMAARRCELGICLVSDQYKNRGFGTRAERLALRYAFETLSMECVTAKCLHQNARSRHVLMKAGFRPVSEDERFQYFAIHTQQYRREDP